MTLTTVLLLIIIGIVIILAEILFVPGSTIVGIVGLILVIIGVVLAFPLGRTTGYMVSGGTLLVIGALGFFAFKSKTWQRFAVRAEIDGKAQETLSFAVGQQGITLTRCAPIGKAEFANGTEEVYSSNDYIEANVPVVIDKINENKIIVKPINQIL